MSVTQKSSYVQSSFRDMIEKMQEHRYGTVRVLCREIRHYIAGLRAGGLLQDESCFVTRNEVAMAIIEDRVHRLTVMFMPYLRDLVKRESDSHDGSTCLGKCAL